MAAPYLHLIEATTLFNHPAGTIVTDIDLGNSTGTSKFSYASPDGYKRGKPQFKKIYADSPMQDGKLLVSYRLAPREDIVTFDIIGSGGTVPDSLLAQKSIIDAFLLRAMDAQVARNAGGGANFFYIADRPNGTATNTFNSEIIEGECELPANFYSVLMMSNMGERLVLHLVLQPYVSASILTILAAVAANNGDGDFVDIAASGGTSITGDLPAPLSVKVKGGDATTTRLLCALRTRGTPSNFQQIYWAKDAAFTSATVARNGDATFDGNNTTNGSRTTAANTNENKTHRWVNTTNVSDQFGRFHAYARCRSSIAARYSLRLQLGLTDGTNDVFPQDGGYTLSTPTSVGTDSGNNLAWVDLGEFDNPSLSSLGAGFAAVYGLVFQVYATCSNITGTPTLDVDGIWLFPIGEGAVGTGLVQATYDLATGAAGVDNAVISAIPGDPAGFLANASDVITFPKQPEAGAALFGIPARAARLFIVLLDATNSRHNHTFVTAVTVKHELRQANVIGA